MPWHAPVTVTFPFTPDEDYFNEQIRDNLTVLKTIFDDDGVPSGALQVAVQSAALTKNNATFEDLPDLAFDVEIGDTWVFFALIFFTGNATDDLQLTLSGPTPSATRFGIVAQAAGTSTQSATAFGTGVNLAVPNTQNNCLILGGTVVNGGTAGTVQVQGAEVSSGGGNTVFAQYSLLVAFKVF